MAVTTGLESRLTTAPVEYPSMVVILSAVAFAPNKTTASAITPTPNLFIFLPCVQVSFSPGPRFGRPSQLATSQLVHNITKSTFRSSKFRGSKSKGATSTLATDKGTNRNPSSGCPRCDGVAARCNPPRYLKLQGSQIVQSGEAVWTVRCGGGVVHAAEICGRVIPLHQSSTEGACSFDCTARCALSSSSSCLRSSLTVLAPPLMWSST